MKKLLKKLVKILKKVSKTLLIVISIFLSFLFATSSYIKTNFSDSNFEQLYVSFMDSEGFSFTAIKPGLIYTIIGGLIILIIIFIIPLILKRKLKYQYTYSLSIKNKKILILRFPLDMGICYFVIISSVLLISIAYNIGLPSYIENQVYTTNIYDKYYVNPSNVKITFPKEKKNLIYIYVESFESSFNTMLKEDGTIESYIPDLEQLAIENINFSNTDELGGAYTLPNTTWTMAGLVAQTAGVPMSASIGANEYGGYKYFLPGAYSLGEVLEENGYKNYFMLGSDAKFASRDEYFKQHGNYQLLDYNYAIENGLIEDDYYVWWGYEDKKLFEFAKIKLTEISEKDEPFNFTMLTADTHFQDGYLDEECSGEFDTAYGNVVACSSNMIYEFIKWIQEQEFYDETVIVIVGDHLTMQYGEFINKISTINGRTIYNVFINTETNPVETKNRAFSTLDLYPTTLAALGVKVEGERLGLGTNLFSEKTTLMEELGWNYLNEEIPKKSLYYNTEILQSSYLEMVEDEKNKDSNK